MGIREEGQRRIRTATVGIAAASLIGTAALAVTVAVQGAAEATTDSTDNDTTDQGGTGFTQPGGNLNNGGTDNSGSFIQPDTGNSGSLPHARSGGSR
jgi:hypothetical protein